MKRTVTDHDAGRVGGGVPVKSLELQPKPEKMGHLLILIALAAEFRLLLDRLGERDRLAGLFGTSLQIRSTWP